MPTHFNTRAEIIRAFPTCIESYNNSPRCPFYNQQYASFIQARAVGIQSLGLVRWLKTPQAGSAIRSLMKDFDMDKRNSVLVPTEVFNANVSKIPEVTSLDCLVQFRLSEEALVKPAESSTVGEQITRLFNYCAEPGHFSESGGFVIGTKVAHCIVPELVPMIDSKVAVFLYNVSPREYKPPHDDWRSYIGHEAKGKPNPSPRGDGWKLWKADQVLCAIGFYARLYQDWLAAAETRGVQAFLALDRTGGATGIPRLLDKVLW